MLAPNIRCCVGGLNLSPLWPWLETLTLGGRSIPQWFDDAWRLPNGESTIRLTVEQLKKLPLEPSGSQADAGVNSLKLQQTLATLTGNSTVPTANGVSNVGLIFADYYKPMPVMYGFMFDLGI